MPKLSHTVCSYSAGSVPHRRSPNTVDESVCVRSGLSELLSRETI